MQDKPTPECTCPVCELEADSETIACEECNEWFHFQCAGLPNEDVKNIRGNSPLISKCCNDNVQYGIQRQTSQALQPNLPTQSGTGDSNMPSSPVQRNTTCTTPEHQSLSQSNSLHHKRPTNVVITAIDYQPTFSTLFL